MPNPLFHNPLIPPFLSIIRAGFVVTLATALMAGTPAWAAPASVADASPCYATHNDGATVFDSADAKAVQDAVDAASAGGTVKVAGSCAGMQLRNGTNQTVFIDKALTLEGGYSTANWTTSNPTVNPTVIDAQTAGRVIYAEQPVTISNLTVQNGLDAGLQGGGGAFFAGAATVRNVIFTGNTAAAGNGGGAWFDADGALVNVTFTGNTAKNVGGGAFFNKAASMASSTFAGNSAQNFHGGGAYVIGAAVVNDTTFTGNTSLLDGGGALFLSDAALTNTAFTQNKSTSRNGGGGWFNGTATLAGTTFDGNTAKNYAGGAWFENSATLTDSSFTDNAAAVFSAGGGFFAGASTLTRVAFEENTSNLTGGGANFSAEATLIDTTFTGNETVLEGGGAAFGSKTMIKGGAFTDNVSKMYGGGARFNGASTITGTTFTGNEASDSGGGAWFGDTTNIAGAAFIDNSALVQMGGGLYLSVSPSPSRIVNSLFARNSAAVNGDALYLHNPSISGGSVDVIHVTIARAVLSAGAAIYVGKGDATIQNTLITRHAAGIQQFDTAVVNEDHNLFFGNTANTAGTVNSGGGTVNADPLFIDAASDNYRLALGSPAIDAGVDLGEVTDLDGTPRPTFAGFDIGAFERGIPPSALVVTATTTAPPLQPVTQLTATLASGTEPLTYTWDLGDGSPVVTGSVVSHVYAPTVYTATATASNPYGVITSSVRIAVPYRLLLSVVARESPLPLVLQRRR
jgi:hypothetical protein